MVLSQAELFKVFYALNVSNDGKAQLYPYDEVLKLNEVAKKIDHFSVDGKLVEDSYEVNFTAEDKEFILKNVKSHHWGMRDSAIVISLVEKLA